MLIAQVERYLALRQKLGFKLLLTSRHLRAFARYAVAENDAYICAGTAVAWATKATTRGMRHRRLGDVVRLARFLHAENPKHEIPPANLFAATETRPAPYIYTVGELARIVQAAGQIDLQEATPQRPPTYAMLFGLITATGLRVSEAFNLRMDDLLSDGVLRVSDTKFGKSRLLPLHESVITKLDQYLEVRRDFAVIDDYVFLSVKRRKLCYTTVNTAFRRILSLAGIAAGRTRPPRIHDLRHSFATRVLEQCATRSEAVARHFVALSTYMGHADAANTYWYFQATPELLTHIAAAGESLMKRSVP
jgi:integrase/recombinase XerD